MTASIIVLAISLLVILAGSLLFTNALEHIGSKLGLSTGVTGGILAAIGTALPETTIPLIAIFTGSPGAGNQVGVGAILGAPLMLSTLAIALIGLAATWRYGFRQPLAPERTGLRRDLIFFLSGFGLGCLALFIPNQWYALRFTTAGILVMIYLAYLSRTLKASSRLVTSGHATEAQSPLLAAQLGFPERLSIIAMQLTLALAAIVLGARGFVVGVTTLSNDAGIAPLMLSLLIVPFATELPEKTNSLLWIWKRQDTLAFGNITGALVFQSTLLPAIGVTLTSWNPRPDVRIAITLTLISGLWLFGVSKATRLYPWLLLPCGLCYLAYFSLLSGIWG